jgi:uncharacterized DUF497 family protein
MWYKSYTGLRFHFDERKSRKLRADQTRGIGFEEAVEIFLHPHGLMEDRMHPSSFVPLAGCAACCTRWFLRFAVITKANTIIW